MKITYNKLKTSIEILKKISDFYLDLDIALKLYENIKVVDDKMKFYSDSLQKIIHKYAEKDESGNIILDSAAPFGFQSKNKDAMYQEVNKLENLEVDINLLLINKESLFSSLNTLQKEEPQNPKYRFKVFDLLAIDYMLEN